MKKKSKENLEFLKNTFEHLNNPTVPDEISRNSIVSLVAGIEQTGIKRRKKRTIRTLSVIAAVLAVAIGTGVYIDYANSPKITQMPELIANAETPLSGNTEQTIIDYFTTLRAEYDDMRYDLNLGGFGLKLYSAVEDGAAMESAPESEMGTADREIAMNSSATGTGDYGTTNVQVQGIDEDDILKNDGRYLYILSDRNLKIVDTQNMKLLSDTQLKFTENLTNPDGIYTCGNKLAVIGTSWVNEPETNLQIFDISDKTKPEQIYNFSQDGNFFSSRLVDGKIILLSQHSVHCYNLELEDGYAVYGDVVPTTTVNGEESALEAPMITILPQKNYSDTYTVITVLDLASHKVNSKTSAVLGTGHEVYCTNENLYIISQRYDDDYRIMNLSSTVTEIYRFTFESGIIAADGKGEVAGRILNQFSLDEHNGYIRIATTLTESNQIAVLDSDLKQVAKISGIAPGETIQSVRYIGDYGYVVTFEQTDPLFVIDFKDMENPKIVGELKIPGFSSYLHPFNGYLVGIGTDGDADGVTNGLKISLFDISDPTNPQEIDRFIVDNAYVNSLHKTVMDCAKKDIIGFIFTDNRTGKANFCTLRIKEGKIEHIGTYTNSAEAEQKQSVRYDATGNEYIFYYDSASTDASSILRGTYIGDTLYTVSRTRLCAYPIEGGKLISKLDY